MKIINAVKSFNAATEIILQLATVPSQTPSGIANVLLVKYFYFLVLYLPLLCE